MAHCGLPAPGLSGLFNTCHQFTQTEEWLKGLIMTTLSVKTKRLHITEFDESMAESVHINSLDMDNRHFIPDEVFETAQEARETIIALMSFYTKKDKPLVYSVILHDGRQIGYVQAIPAEEGWEVGYHIAKLYSGNGYAAEAVSAFLPPIMEQLRIYPYLRNLQRG